MYVINKNVSFPFYYRSLNPDHSDALIVIHAVLHLSFLIYVPLFIPDSLYLPMFRSQRLSVLMRNFLSIHNPPSTVTTRHFCSLSPLFPDHNILAFISIHSTTKKGNLRPSCLAQTLLFIPLTSAVILGL